MAEEKGKLSARAPFGPLGPELFDPVYVRDSDVELSVMENDRNARTCRVGRFGTPRVTWLIESWDHLQHPTHVYIWDGRAVQVSWDEWKAENRD